MDNNLRRNNCMEAILHHSSIRGNRMSSRILTCPKCNSLDIEDINPEIKETSKTPIVEVKAKCVSCQHKFKYGSATTWGKRLQVLY